MYMNVEYLHQCESLRKNWHHKIAETSGHY